jgi:hypothetical protein
VEIRGANRQAVLNSFRRDIKDTAYRTFPQSKKRQRFISSEFSLSDALALSDHPPPFRKKTVLSPLSRSYSFRYRRPYHLSPNNPSNGFASRKISSDAVHKSSRVNSILDSRNKSYLIAEKSSRETQGTEYPPSSDPRDILSDPDNSQQEIKKQIVWAHGHLLKYNVRDGKPCVLVPWYPTWELPDEYSKEEVDRDDDGSHKDGIKSEGG